MAQNRGSQRGVVKIASSLLLAGLGALLSVAGCAADDGAATGGAETLGVSAEALVCGQTTCNVDNCTVYKCSLGTCVLSSQKRDGEACVTVAGVGGLCATLMEGERPICCTGCVLRSKLGGYTCQPGGALNACGVGGGACESCASVDKCVATQCVPEKFVCDSNPIPDGRPCSDNSGVCMKGECCTGCFDGGVCQPGNTAKLCGAGGAEKCQSCDDGNPCTDDICGPNGTCLHPAVEAGKSCDTDANMCNGTAKCDGTVCKTTAPVVCNDGNPCTNDTCAAATGQCVYTNNTANCSDGDVCTLVDKCSGGVCLGTGAPNCNDNEECTTDTCDKTLGCQHKAVTENTMCDDGNGCSTGDKCVAGKCSFVSGKNCNDNNPCTIDACSQDICLPTNEVNGTPCVFDRCHINSECQAGKCSEGTAINCDDGNPCTTDTCDAATGCKHVNVDGGACSDGDLCTVSDKCAAGKCAGTEMTCTAIDECHLAGKCNAQTGTCDDPRAPDDTECEDGTGKCLTGKCDVPLGEGGAGGAGTGGDGAAGSLAEGGDPATGSGGEGNAPTTGGDASTTGGKGSGATTGNAAGNPEVPEHVFVREPGGCSCSVPASSSNYLAWLAGLSLVALAGARRRRGGAERRTP